MAIKTLCRFSSAFNLIVLWTVLIEFNNQIFAMEEVSLYKHPLRMPCRFPVKRQTYVRDPLDCSIFYTCYGNRYWRMTCTTPHTIWSLKYKVCVWQNTVFDDCNYVNTNTTSPAPPKDNLKPIDFDTSNELEIKPEPWEKTTRHWVTWRTGTTVQPYTPWVPFSTSTQTPPKLSTTPAITSRTTKMLKHVKPVVVIERKTPQPKFTWRTIQDKTSTSKKLLKTVSRNPFRLRSPSTSRPTTPRPKRKTTKATTTSSKTTDRLTSRPTTSRRPTTVRTTPRPTTPRPTTKTTNRPTTKITTTKAPARFTWDPNFWKQLTKKPFRATTRKPFWNIITKRPVIWIPRRTKPVVTEKPTRATIRIPIEWQRLNESPFTQKPTPRKTTKRPKIVTRKPSTPRPPSTTKRPTKTTTTPTTTRRKVTWLPRTTWRPTTRILTTPSTTTSTTTAITTTLATTRDVTSPRIVERNTEILLRSDTPITVPTAPEAPSTSISIDELTTLEEEIANSRNSDKCGVMPTPLIIGGKPSSPGRWPWQVSLQIIAAIEPWHRCGGVLIHPNWVLTAAHCVEGPFYGDLRNWRIVLSEDNLNEGSGREIYRRISRIVAHPGYIRTSNFPNDVALLQMDEAVDTSSGESRVACLPDLHAEIPPNANCWLSGWGETRGTGGNENSMNELQVEILPNWLCSSMWRRVGIHVLDDQVCVGYGDTGACYGDSGGPLMCELDGRYYVTGVMSWLINNCSARGFPNVFTRVTSYTDWIYEKLEYYDWWH